MEVLFIAHSGADAVVIVFECVSEGEVYHVRLSRLDVPQVRVLNMGIRRYDIDTLAVSENKPYNCRINCSAELEIYKDRNCLAVSYRSGPISEVIGDLAVQNLRLA